MISDGVICCWGPLDQERLHLLLLLGETPFRCWLPFPSLEPRSCLGLCLTVLWSHDREGDDDFFFAGGFTPFISDRATPFNAFLITSQASALTRWKSGAVSLKINAGASSNEQLPILDNFFLRCVVAIDPSSPLMDPSVLLQLFPSKPAVLSRSRYSRVSNHPYPASKLHPPFPPH